jgi:hypothetical protein
MKKLFLAALLLLSPAAFASDGFDTYQCQVNYFETKAEGGELLQDQYTLMFTTQVQNPNGRNELRFSGKLAKAKLDVTVVITDMEHSCKNPADCLENPEWKKFFIVTTHLESAESKKSKYFSGGFTKGQKMFQNSMGIDGADANIICSKQ